LTAMADTTGATLWAIARPQRRALGVGIALAIIQAAALLPIPLLVAAVFDRALPAGDRPLLAGLAAAIVACSALNAVAAVGAQSAVLQASRAISATLRRRTLDAVGRLSLLELRRADADRFQDLMVQDAARVDGTTATVALMLLPSALVVGGVGCVLVAIEPALAGALALLAPAMAVTTRLARTRLHASTDDTHDAVKRYHGTVIRWTTGQELIRLRAQSDHEAIAAGHVIDALRVTGARRQVAVAQFSAVQLVLVAIASGAVLVLGGFAVIDGSLSPGGLLAFYAAVGLARSPLSQLVTSYPSVIEGRLAWRRIAELLAIDHPEPYGPGRSIVPTAELRLDDVSYTYPPRTTETHAEPVVARCTVVVRRGELVALVGPNGSGKSTVLAMLLGFLRPTSGVASADGVAYDALDIATLRASVGVVQQHPDLFAGTIRDAVTYGHGAVTDEMLDRALTVAGAGFVHHLPLGVATVIGAGGASLSGGQRQRLAIARAMLGDPAFLVLDEPTNHMDEDAVHTLLHALSTLPHHPGVLVITHRPELAALADRVVDLAGDHSTVPYAFASPVEDESTTSSIAALRS
jgi:ABC-type multidrug transport system fused ATPase/permease subunit